MKTKKTVVLITGPTCTGKTALSFYLSSQFQGKIINADSLQFYKYMDIGTSKPRADQLDPHCHFLFNCTTPPHIYTAGEFNRNARILLKKYTSKYICFVVGGSGFYLQALEKGCYPVQAVSTRVRNELLKTVQTQGLKTLYKELVLKDPEYAQKIHERDQYRIVRALSLIRGENKKMSEIQRTFQKNPLPYNIIKIGLTASSSVLKKRIQNRVQNMLDWGLIKEVQFLCDQGWKDFPPMKSVGYKEVLLYLQGTLPKEELYNRIVQRTVQLVKKQKTWFKKDSSIRWYDCETCFEEISQDIKSKLLATQL